MVVRAAASATWAAAKIEPAASIWTPASAPMVSGMGLSARLVRLAAAVLAQAATAIPPTASFRSVRQIWTCQAARRSRSRLTKKAVGSDGLGGILSMWTAEDDRGDCKEYLWRTAIPTALAEVVAVLRIQHVQFKSGPRSDGQQLGQFAQPPGCRRTRSGENHGNEACDRGSGECLRLRCAVLPLTRLAAADP
jgi:hypothetical protein